MLIGHAYQVHLWSAILAR